MSTVSLAYDAVKKAAKYGMGRANAIGQGIFRSYAERGWGGVGGYASMLLNDGAAGAAAAGFRGVGAAARAGASSSLLQSFGKEAIGGPLMRWWAGEVRAGGVGAVNSTARFARRSMAYTAGGLAGAGMLGGMMGGRRRRR